MGRAKIALIAVTTLIVVGIAQTGLAVGPSTGPPDLTANRPEEPGKPSTGHVPPGRDNSNPNPGPSDQANPNADGGNDKAKPKDPVTTTTIAVTTTTLAPATRTVAPKAASPGRGQSPTTDQPAPAAGSGAVSANVSDAIATLAGQMEPSVPRSAVVLAATSRLPLSDVLAFVGDVRVEAFLAAPLLALQVLARALGSAGQGLLAPAAMLAIVAGLMARDRRLPGRPFGS